MASLQPRTLLAAVAIGLAAVPVPAHAVTGFRHAGVEATLTGAILNVLFFSRGNADEGHDHDVTLTLTTDDNRSFAVKVRPRADGMMAIPLDYEKLHIDPQAGARIVSVQGVWNPNNHHWGGSSDRPSGGPFTLPPRIIPRATAETTARLLARLATRAGGAPAATTSRTTPTPSTPAAPAPATPTAPQAARARKTAKAVTTAAPAAQPVANPTTNAREAGSQTSAPIAAHAQARALSRLLQAGRR